MSGTWRGFIWATDPLFSSENPGPLHGYTATHDARMPFPSKLLASSVATARSVDFKVSGMNPDLG